MPLSKKQYGSINYCLSGDNPVVLFLSGMHGNEYQSGEYLQTFLSDNLNSLPAFLSISQVSPSAVARQTRLNRWQHDVNRKFFADTDDPEAWAVVNILKNFHFRLAIDVHEDPDRTQAFYLYDSAKLSSRQLNEFREMARAAGARLYTGVDDFEDEFLGIPVTKGYVSLPPEMLSPQAGFSTLWLIEKGISKREFTLEIPGKALPTLKQQLIKKLIPFLVTI